jgi:hypothetical protein
LKASTFLPGQQPALADIKSCEAWLGRASLSDPKQACHELTSLLESLEDISPEDSVYIEILERLREPVIVSLAEHGKKFSGRPLPLREYELTAFDQVYDLWSTLGRAYRRLLRMAVEDRRPTLVAQSPLLAQRALDCTSELMFAHYRCRREVDSELWRDLHQLMQAAEAGGFSAETVPTSLRAKNVSSCTEVYVRALLLQLANPYTLSMRELSWARRWAAMWAYKVDLVAAAHDAQGYAADLASDQPPTWLRADVAHASTRFLETANLRRSIRTRMKKLELGVDPQTLGLGRDCVQPEVGRLLVTLSRGWIDVPSPRQFSRRLVPGRVELTCGFESIHLAISGQIFRNAVRHWDYSRRDAEQLQIYQGVLHAATDTQAGFTAEKWESLDESANGFRLRRKGGGERLSHQQLVALKPQDGRSFILSEVRWMMTAIDRTLVIGVAALPGLARAVAVRAANPEGVREPYTQAFIVPESAAGPQSLVLPSGWYQSGRQLDVRIDDDVLNIKLAGVVQRGYDYDRANFYVTP